ncbi:MAG: response regulator [Candidatus Sumerlaeaceae bacterium]|nr:response regulator [Candidatus Sumerlaeaceae bacterium]
MANVIPEEEGNLVGEGHSMVLVVGPNRENLCAMKQVLEDSHVEILMACSFVEFEERIASKPIDVVVIDTLRYHPQIFQQFHLLFDRQISVVIVANTLAAGERNDALSRGCTEALQKPVPINLLRKVVQSALSRRKRSSDQRAARPQDTEPSPSSSANDLLRDQESI